MPSKLFLLSIIIFPFFVGSLKIVPTSYGRVRGITNWADSKNHKYIFKSIPFAKPPVGDLRFALPEDPEPWNDVLDASRYSLACLSNFRSVNISRPMGEDCLYLNIFTSERCFEKNCAVLVYFHGGAFKLDSAVMFDDNFILERYVSEDVVFVIPAYRLGSLGQLYFGPNGILTENLLMFDVVKALNYVHNEIGNFGGNPNRVTLMGHSAGGIILNALGFSTLFDPDANIFQQMITISAQGEFGFYNVAIDISFVLAEKLGCSTFGNRNSANITDILTCLRKVDSAEILKVQKEIIGLNESNFKSIIRGAPFMELNGLLSENKKNAPKRNMICGTTALEYKDNPYKFHAAGTFLDFENPHAVVEHYYESMNGHEENWTDPLSSAIFISARTYCEAVTLAGGDAYIYESRQKPNSYHLTDMQYFIGIHREAVHTDDMDILDSFYSKMLVNFTKTGVPSPKWEKLDTKKMNYLELKVDSELHGGPEMKTGFHDNLTKFWFEDVAEYDRNVTKWMQRNSKIRSDNRQHAAVPVTVRPINLNKSTTTKVVLLDIPKETDHTSEVFFEKWWFYLVIIIVMMIVAFVFLSCEKAKTDEETPLLA